MTTFTIYSCKHFQRKTHYKINKIFIQLDITSASLKSTNMEEKTNAIRQLERQKLSFAIHTYDSSKAISGVEVAAQLNQNPDKVFKTLVCTGKTGKHYVFIVPVAMELDLKKAAKSVGEKSMEMLKQKDLLSLTGYIHGGCSPIGMKKFFTTTIDESAKNFDTIIFSGGKIGLQIETSQKNLAKVIRLQTANLLQ